MTWIGSSGSVAVPVNDVHSWPADARASLLVHDALVSVQFPDRPADRSPCTTRAIFHPEQDGRSVDPFILYTRDAGAQTISFITTRVLTPGQRGTLEMNLTDGSIRRSHAIVRRCQSYARGWFEGIVHCRASQPLRRSL